MSASSPRMRSTSGFAPNAAICAIRLSLAMRSAMPSMPLALIISSRRIMLSKGSAARRAASRVPARLDEIRSRDRVIANLVAQLAQALLAYRGGESAQHLDALGQPRQLLRADLVVLGIAGLHIGLA